MSCAFDEAVTSYSRHYGLILVSEDFHTWKGWGRAQHTVTPGQGCRVTRLCDGSVSRSRAESWWWSLWFRLPTSTASTTEWSLMNAAGSPQRLQWLLGSSAAPLGPRSRTGGGKWNQWCIHTQLQGSAIDAYVVAGASCRHTPSTGCQGRQAGPGPAVSTLAAARVPGYLHALPQLHSLHGCVYGKGGASSNRNQLAVDKCTAGGFSTQVHTQWWGIEAAVVYSHSGLDWLLVRSLGSSRSQAGAGWGENNSGGWRQCMQIPVESTVVVLSVSSMVTAAGVSLERVARNSSRSCHVPASGSPCFSCS